jgi:DNA-binding MarR family transcriptional regulator
MRQPCITCAHGSLGGEIGKVKRPGKGDLERWAELADRVLVIAREIQFRGYEDAPVVPLTATEGMIMRYLQEHPVAAPNQIAAAVGLQRSNLSTLMRGLEGHGLIERTVSESDRRGVMVRLTERGRRNYLAARRAWADSIASAAGNDMRSLNGALTLLREIAAGLIAMRPEKPGRDMARSED